MESSEPKPEAMSIGVFGGTFDPIHCGHLAAAEEALHALSLNRVLFLPSSEPPHKTRRQITATEARVAMVELALRSNPAFVLSRVDVDRPGPSYSVDTMAILTDELGPSTEFSFIIGLDILWKIPVWKEPERLLAMTNLAVVTRPGYRMPNMGDLRHIASESSKRLSLIHMSGPDISSTDLRERVADGRSITGEVPAAVEEYIYRRGLYRFKREELTAAPPHMWHLSTEGLNRSTPASKNMSMPLVPSHA